MELYPDSGSKLYSCDACSKNFDKRKSYVYHLKKGRCPGKPEPKKLHKVTTMPSSNAIDSILIVALAASNISFLLL